MIAEKESNFPESMQGGHCQQGDVTIRGDTKNTLRNEAVSSSCFFSSFPVQETFMAVPI